MPSPSPYLEATTVNFDTDCDELVESYWESWKHPITAWGELACPYLGTGTAEEVQALADLKKRMLHIAQNNSDMVWRKCTDKRTGRIVGGAVGKICRKSPHDAPESNVEATWFPEGSDLKELCEHMLAHLDGWRLKFMKNAHFFRQDGEEAWVLPEYRTQGAASLLYKELVVLADGLQLEAYVEVTDLAMSVARRHGFVFIGRTNIVCQRKNPSEHWKRLAEDLRRNSLGIMWRPVGGYVEGQTVFPWEGKPRDLKL